VINATAIVLGCTHDIQRIRPIFVPQPDIPRHVDQQRKFAHALAQLVIERNLSFIGEEIGYNEPSIIQVLANALGIQYSNIDMPLAERARKGCPGSYEVLFAVEGRQSEVEACDSLREEYMTQRAAEFFANDETALIVCGERHAARLCNQLTHFAKKVQRRSVAEFTWFDRTLYRWENPLGSTETA
jgi:hypothetical protein